MFYAVTILLLLASTHLYAQVSTEGYAEVIEGVKYWNGIGVPIDSMKAANLFKYSAQIKHPLGIYYYGYVNDIGFGVSADKEKAKKMYKEAFLGIKQLAEAGDSYAQCVLGDMYWFGDGVEKDSIVGLQWYKKSAEQGNPRGLLDLAAIYDNSKNYKAAFPLFKKAAELNSATGMSMVGLYYYEGRVVKKNSKEGVSWFKKAADLGLGLAQRNLAFAFLDGEGTPKDLSASFKYFSLITQKDNSDDIADGLVELYFAAEKANNTEVIDKIRDAAKSGNPMMAHAVGEFYRGNSDNTTAEIWFKKAAESNLCPAASFNVLGLIIEKKEGQLEGLKYYERAAAMGNPNGQYNAALTLWNTDKINSGPRVVKLLKESASQGNEDAKKMLKKVEPEVAENGSIPDDAPCVELTFKMLEMFHKKLVANPLSTEKDDWYTYSEKSDRMRKSIDCSQGVIKKSEYISIVDLSEAWDRFRQKFQLEMSSEMQRRVDRNFAECKQTILKSKKIMEIAFQKKIKRGEENLQEDLKKIKNVKSGAHVSISEGYGLVIQRKGDMVLIQMDKEPAKDAKWHPISDIRRMWY